MDSSAIKNFSVTLFENYYDFLEKSLFRSKIKHQNIQPLINKRSKEIFTTKVLGQSIEGRDIFLIDAGKGETSVLLWSQMHGNESSGTAALFDIFNFFEADADYVTLKTETEFGNLNVCKDFILSNLQLHFVPMLNPDGAEAWKRRNAVEIDLNRDALRLQAPESQILKNLRDETQAVFGFNLHDQNRHYSAGRSIHPATISFLAPPFNETKAIDDVRQKAMQLIIEMDNVLQQFIPGQIARYSDDFEPRAFGDQMMNWGTASILIESGGFPNDIERQYVRKLNFVVILSALLSIANESYKKNKLRHYKSIPENSKNYADLILRDVKIEKGGQTFQLDMAFNNMPNGAGDPIDMPIAYLSDMGDLSNMESYDEFEARNFTIKKGKTYPEVINSLAELKQLDVSNLLKQSYLYIKSDKLMGQDDLVSPLKIISPDDDSNKFEIFANPSFFLTQNNLPHYALIDAKLIGVAQYVKP